MRERETCERECRESNFSIRFTKYLLSLLSFLSPVVMCLTHKKPCDSHSQIVMSCGI